MDIFVRETNRYGQLKKGSDWTQTNKEEFFNFFGLLLLMGFIRLPTIREYWKKDSSFKIPLFYEIMSCKRFEVHYTCTHLMDECHYTTWSTWPYKLYKVRPLIKSLNTAFRDIYYPTCELSIDERMVGFKFKGRLGFKQYLPLKSTKWEIKLWVLCEAKSGYTLNFSVYCGKESTTTNAQPLGSRVVFELMEPYYMKWHQLFMDNFYSFLNSANNY